MAYDFANCNTPNCHYYAYGAAGVAGVAGAAGATGAAGVAGAAGAGSVHVDFDWDGVNG